MTQSVYLVGGAGTGKSTFMAQLLGSRVIYDFRVLHKGQTGMGLVPLGGHPVEGLGVYLGRMREHFPGTDALNRAASPVGVEWLGLGNLPSWIVGEGITLGTRPFLYALADATDLLLVHLHADPFVKELRALARVAEVTASGMVFHDRTTVAQADSFITGTATRAANLERDMAKVCATLAVDSADQTAWAEGLEQASAHLWGLW